jgi:hypothetical protein
MERYRQIPRRRYIVLVQENITLPKLHCYDLFTIKILWPNSNNRNSRDILVHILGFCKVAMLVLFMISYWVLREDFLSHDTVELISDFYQKL